MLILIVCDGLGLEKLTLDGRNLHMLRVGLFVNWNDGHLEQETHPVSIFF